MGPSPWADELNWQQLVATVVRLSYDQTQPITTAEVIVSCVIDHPEAYGGRRVPELTPVRVDAERERALASMPYTEYLLSPEWDALRKAALKRAGYLCQVCNRSRVLHVHHRTYERRGAELPGDLTVLCDECHALFHGKNLISDEPETILTEGER